jgi:hypothetical protein
MKKQVLFAAGVSALLAGAPFVSAQAPAQTPPPSDPSSQSASPSSSSSPQTVTGCLTPGADGKSFILTEISPSGSSSSAASATPKTWTVVSSGDVDLSKYANHKVEITGSPEDKGRSSAYPPPSSSPSTAAATSGPTLQVKSVKDVSNSCS